MNQAAQYGTLSKWWWPIRYSEFSLISCFRIVDLDIPSIFLNGNVSAPSMFSNLKSISLVRNITKCYTNVTINLNSGKRISFLFAGSWSLSEDATVNISFLNKIALTWLSHLNSKQGKVSGQVSDKEAMMVCASKSGPSSCFLTEHFWWTLSKWPPLSLVFLPLPRLSQATGARSDLVTGHRGAGGSIGNIIRATASTAVRCHLENSWELDPGVTAPSRWVTSEIFIIIVRWIPQFRMIS